jgi:hypothetical protein
MTYKTRREVLDRIRELKEELESKRLDKEPFTFDKEGKQVYEPEFLRIVSEINRLHDIDNEMRIKGL